jgi:hypothetical protein
MYIVTWNQPHVDIDGKDAAFIFFTGDEHRFKVLKQHDDFVSPVCRHIYSEPYKTGVFCEFHRHR